MTKNFLIEAFADFFQVYNAVDAKARCVAVRVDLQRRKVQVIDNGLGISKDGLEKVGTRYRLNFTNPWYCAKIILVGREKSSNWPTKKVQLAFLVIKKIWPLPPFPRTWKKRDAAYDNLKSWVTAKGCSTQWTSYRLVLHLVQDVESGNTSLSLWKMLQRIKLFLFF